jgi:hypothetical protein
VTYRWPGSLAELWSIVEGGAHQRQREHRTIASHWRRPGALCPARRSQARSTASLPAQLDDLARRELCSALERCGEKRLRWRGCSHSGAELDPIRQYGWTSGARH